MSETTPKDIQRVARTRQRRKIGMALVKAMAKCAARRMTDREACALLGIKYDTWAHWLMNHRNKEQYAAAIDEFTAAKIDAHLSNIEDASRGKGPHQRADWRASEAYMELTIPRFSKAETAPAPAVTVNVALVDRACDTVLKLAAKGQLPALPAPGTTNESGV